MTFFRFPFRRPRPKPPADPNRVFEYPIDKFNRVEILAYLILRP
jgi:hypothetical protein